MLFRSVRRPKTVMDLKLSISILDSELISKIYHYQVPVKSIIKDIVAKHIHDLINREIEESNNSLIDEGMEEMTDTGKIFERFRVMDKYISDEDNEDSKRYQFIAKKFVDSVDGLQAEIDADDYDVLSIRENIRKIIDNENIRNRGFNTAVNTITAILDTSKMGYQFIENFKNARECIIREYEEENENKLPDERYQLRLVYYDQEQLKSLRKAYATQIEELNREIMHLWDVCEGIYTQDRDLKGYDDWDTLANKMLKTEGEKNSGFFKSKKPPVVVEEKKRLWNEISFIPPQETIVDKSNPTEEAKIEEMANRFPIMLEKLHTVFSDSSEETRQVVENRLEFLKDQFERFSNLINPFHVQPGLLLDIDISSIKKKKTTMMNMANVINEFLHSISKGYSDIRFADLSKSRSFERNDINQEFVSAGE